MDRSSWTDGEGSSVMNARSALVGAGAVLAVVASPGPVVAADAAGPATPNGCIEVNGGDWNACNIGHSRRGDLPYLPLQAPAHSVARCIQRNVGDAPACLVGSVGGHYVR
jgi:hypothetical protein